MPFQGTDPPDRYIWYQSPHLGLSPAGYADGVSSGCYCHYPMAASYHLQGGSVYPPPHHFTQPNYYPPPQHNYYPPPQPEQPHSYPPPPQNSHSGTLINGHWLPPCFPYASPTWTQCHPSLYPQPTYPIAPQPLTLQQPLFTSVSDEPNFTSPECEPDDVVIPSNTPHYAPFARESALDPKLALNNPTPAIEGEDDLDEEPGEEIESAPLLKVGEETEFATYGLKKKLLKSGTGWESPEVGDEATVHYGGSLMDGTKFESRLSTELLRAVERAGSEKPSPIQMTAIPLGLQQRDVIRIAEPGSGKTAAFVLPVLTYISRLPPISEENEAEVPYAVVMAPTRELAQQIEEETVKFAHYLGIKVVSIVRGRSIEEQGFKIRQGCEVVIATPGRLIDCWERRYAVLNQCNYAVLDEADRMIDMGFELQFVGVFDAMLSSNFKPKNEDEELDDKKIYITTYMFGATMPPAVECLARKYLRNPVVVTTGTAGKTIDLITQNVVWSKDAEKFERLKRLLDELGDKTAIVFVNAKKTADYCSWRMHMSLVAWVQNIQWSDGQIFGAVKLPNLLPTYMTTHKCFVAAVAPLVYAILLGSSNGVWKQGHVWSIGYCKLLVGFNCGLRLGGYCVQSANPASHQFQDAASIHVFCYEGALTQPPCCDEHSILGWNYNAKAFVWRPQVSQLQLVPYVRVLGVILTTTLGNWITTQVIGATGKAENGQTSTDISNSLAQNARAVLVCDGYSGSLWLHYVFIFFDIGQSPLSQIFTALHIQFQHVRRSFVGIVSGILELSRNGLHCNIRGEIWPLDTNVSPHVGTLILVGNLFCLHLELQFETSLFIGQRRVLLDKSATVMFVSKTAQYVALCSIHGGIYVVEVMHMEHELDGLLCQVTLTHGGQLQDARFFLSSCLQESLQTKSEFSSSHYHSTTTVFMAGDIHSVVHLTNCQVVFLIKSLDIGFADKLMCIPNSSFPTWAEELFQMRYILKLLLSMVLEVPTVVSENVTPVTMQPSKYHNQAVTAISHFTVVYVAAVFPHMTIDMEPCPSQILEFMGLDMEQKRMCIIWIWLATTQLFSQVWALHLHGMIMLQAPVLLGDALLIREVMVLGHISVRLDGLGGGDVYNTTSFSLMPLSTRCWLLIESKTKQSIIEFLVQSSAGASSTLGCCSCKKIMLFVSRVACVVDGLENLPFLYHHVVGIPSLGTLMFHVSMFSVSFDDYASRRPPIADFPALVTGICIHQLYVQQTPIPQLSAPVLLFHVSRVAYLMLHACLLVTTPETTTAATSPAMTELNQAVQLLQQALTLPTSDPSQQVPIFSSLGTSLFSERVEMLRV